GSRYWPRTNIRAPTPTCSRWRRSSPPSCRWARWAASMRSRCRRIPRSSSSGIVDGAAAVLIGNREAGLAAKLKPRAKIRAFANIGSEPALMLTGPVDVTEKLFERSGMKKSDIDLFELNEAFASVVLRFMQALELDPGKVN